MTTDLVINVDLLDDGLTLAQKAAALFPLAKESLKRRQIDALWKEKVASSPAALAAALLSPPVLEALRKEIRRTSGHRLEGADLEVLLRDTVLRSECLEQKS